MSTSYYTGESIFSSGAVLLNRDDQKVYLVFKNSTGEWLLPKGHMEKGETIEESAKREIFEETGYKAEVKDLLSVQVRQDILEPSKNKIIFWFLALLIDREQAKNTQMEDESFSGEWKSKEDAVQMLKWDEDKKLTEKAFTLI